MTPGDASTPSLPSSTALGLTSSCTCLQRVVQLVPAAGLVPLCMLAAVTCILWFIDMLVCCRVGPADASKVTVAYDSVDTLSCIPHKDSQAEAKSGALQAP